MEISRHLKLGNNRDFACLVDVPVGISDPYGRHAFRKARCLIELRVYREDALFVDIAPPSVDCDRRQVVTELSGTLIHRVDRKVSILLQITQLAAQANDCQTVV